MVLAACGGSTQPAVQQQAGNQVFTYDTTAPVMVDGWDPATEYSDGIIAMSEMYETLTRYNTATHTGQAAARDQLVILGQRPDLDVPPAARGALPHRPADDRAGGAAAAILRTDKLGGGAAYIWGAVKTISTPSTYTMVFHLKYASPLDLEASAAYSAYIYDTQAAGGGGT